MIYNYEKDGLLRKELYDLRTDPAEKVNIYDEKKGTEETHKMEKRFDAFIRDGLHYKKEIRSKNAIEVDEQTQERLRALGYMQ